MNTHVVQMHAFPLAFRTLTTSRRRRLALFGVVNSSVSYD